MKITQRKSKEQDQSLRKTQFWKVTTKKKSVYSVAVMLKSQCKGKLRKVLCSCIDYQPNPISIIIFYNINIEI